MMDPRIDGRPGPDRHRRVACGAALAAAVLGAGVAAQVASPGTVYLRSEAPGSSHGFGADAAGRWQVVDGNLRGRTGLLSEVAFRLDYRQHTPLTAAGRTWDRVEVSVGEGDRATFGPRFDGNWLGQPVRVFDGAVAWPAAAGVPPTCPAPWGGAGGGLRFPFASPWAHAGARDTVLQFVFRGGRLDNRAAWTGPEPYLLDSYRHGAAVEGQETKLGRYFVTGGCSDSSARHNFGAFGVLVTSTYGPDAPENRNCFALSYQAHRLGPHAPVFTALGLRPHGAGLPVTGVSCNRLHVDPGSIVDVFVGQADNIGTLPRTYFGLPNFGLVTYAPQLAGASLVAQSVWSDTRTGALLLAAASHNTLQPISPFATAAATLRQTVAAADPLSATGTLRIGDAGFDPICRLTLR